MKKVGLESTLRPMFLGICLEYLVIPRFIKDWFVKVLSFEKGPVFKVKGSRVPKTFPNVDFSAKICTNMMSQGVGEAR